MRVMFATTLICAALGGGAGCTGDGPVAEQSVEVGDGTQADESTDVTVASSPDITVASRDVTVASLDLSLRLPTGFVLAESPELEFIARSLDPQAVLTIAREGPEVVLHEPEPGEQLSNLDGLGDKAVVVENAVLKGLPPGIVANELFVANGDRSFSLILSAEEGALDALWAQLLDSIDVG